jgi:VanZ family protein
LKLTKKDFFHPKIFISAWLPVILWMGVIFFFSSLPQQHASQIYLLDFSIKKIAHLSEYGILYALFYRATGNKLILSLILTIIYASTDEFHQMFVPGRTARVYDILGFDLVGASIAAFIIWKLKQLYPRKH